MIDTHVHLNFPQFRPDMEAVIADTWAAGMTHMINVGTDLDTSRESVNLAGRFQHIYAAVGLHPHEAKDFATVAGDLIKLSADSKVIAIGEIGLDYYRNLSTPEDQVVAFTSQLEMALAVAKPVILHSRDAYSETLSLLEEHYLPHLNGRRPGILHSFNGGLPYAQKFMKAGFLLGINNLVTYPQSTSLQTALADIPIEMIVLETDCPYLPPQRIRNSRSEPIHIQDAAAKIAEIKNIAVADVLEQTHKNAVSLFNF